MEDIDDSSSDSQDAPSWDPPAALQQRDPSHEPCLTAHRVICNRRGAVGEDHSDHKRQADYFDVPRLFATDTRASLLRGKDEINDLQEYAEDHPQFRMLVIKEYSCERYHEFHADEFTVIADGFHKTVLKKIRPWLYRLSTPAPPAKEDSESIVISDRLSHAITALVDRNQPHLGRWDRNAHLREPYDYFYHFRRQLRQTFADQLDSSLRQDLFVLLDYIDRTKGPKFDEIDQIFASGMVHRDLFSKLFAPNEIIVTMQSGSPRALVANKVVLHQLAGGKKSISLECWSWSFDGSFRKKTEIVDVKWPTSEGVQVTMDRLSAWPLRLDKPSTRNSLLQRGRKFWSCRHKKLVCYTAPTPTIFELQITNPKYMVDYRTYRQMHPSKDMVPLRTKTEMKEQGIDMDDDEPPDDLFCLLLPTTVLGYAFHDKKWRTLSMEHIGPVPWNKEAFSRLVLKPKKKETIKALVTVHLKTVQDVDVVENKGNGLIILLHGSPGTGKTLTAESVAEIAEKPLYRVTCGDIGSDAESVERYMESVLLVGTIWECVVLLDEADVFLEERQVTDLARNALVSVFLRILEYYDGILILTTNRVGSFDEAFKSRIQLAIHYPALNQDDRLQVWLNFINIMHDKKVDMDFEELKRKADYLARIPFNGRQIRNILWTAAQVAKYKNQTLDYSNLEQVVEISQEFEEYLLQTHGLTDEDNARAQRMRGS